MSASAERPPLNRVPLDAGDWFPLRMFVHAAGGAWSGGALVLALAGLLTGEAGVAVFDWFAGGDVAVTAPLPQHVGEGNLQPLEIAAAAAAGQRDYAAGFALPVAAGSVGGAVVAGWRLLVWGLFGAAITQIAARRLTRLDPPTAAGALSRSVKTLLGNVFGVGVLAIGAVSLFALVRVLGWLGLASVLWPVAFVCALMGVLLTVGVVVGWPLMVAASAAERPDPFDAVSRGIAYTYQRPLRLVGYAVQAWLIGAAAGACVHLVLRPTLAVTRASFETLAGDPIAEGAALDAGAAATVLTPASDAAGFWFELIARLPLVYHAAYFWFAATAIYLLLRRDIDDQQADEIFIEDPPSADQVSTDKSAAPPAAEELVTVEPLPASPLPNGQSAEV